MTIRQHTTNTGSFTIPKTKKQARKSADHSLSLTTRHPLKDPASAITHLIGMLFAIFSVPFLMQRAILHHSRIYVVSSAVFIFSMILLYLASTCYHAITTTERLTLLLKKLDHIMIYFLIAGTYTPICLLALPQSIGLPMLALIWGLAFAGLFLTAVWVNSPKWLNSIIYISMGWLCVFALGDIRASTSHGAFLWLLFGGIIYTIGGIIYALKLPFFNSIHKSFGSHEIFHLFVMGGSLCHFIMIYGYLLK